VYGIDIEMKCRGCGNERALIKAHIIPRSFYMDLRGSEGFLHVVPSEFSLRTSRSPIGDYDANILCCECDQYLAVFDDYGKRVLIDKNCPFEELSRDGVVAGWTIKGCDVSRLEKFILAVLWRASITNREFFRNVRLGPYEEIIRAHLWGQQEHHKSLGCIVAKFRESSAGLNVHKTILDPHPFKYEGRNYYKLYLGGYMVWVRVDQRKSSDFLARFELSSNQNCVVISRSFDGSNEHELIKKGVEAQERKNSHLTERRDY
jgi:hypothetical protein